MKMKKQKCPNCGSTRLYSEISIMAKQNVNTLRIYDINKFNLDNAFQITYCEKCGWADDEKYSQVETK
jgi:predicted nucleic-acid-binding Zn-ribbon protein